MQSRRKFDARACLAPLIAVKEDNVADIEGMDDEEQQGGFVQVPDVVAEYKYKGEHA